MKWTLLTLFVAQFVLATPRPSESLFEIEKQRLIKFPEETFPTESNEQKSIDAKRILEEIDKINVALGYVKKQESHIPSILDSNQFLFPKPSYHPFYSQTNGDTLQPSIRNLNVILNPQSLRNAQNPKSIKLNEPKLFFYYYLPKTAETATENKSQHSDTKIQAKLPLRETEDNIAPNFRKPLLNNASSSLKNKKLATNIRNKKLARIEKLPTIRPFSKATTEKQNLNNAFPTSKVKKQVTSFPTSTTLSPPISSLKTPFASFFNRPSNVPASQKVEAKPILQSVPLSSPQFAHQQAKPEVNSNDDYKWGEISSEESDNSEEFEKHIFSAKRKEVAEVQKEALKESGIIIQRLKVRKGGIAIAGPGGVATAGSGGTAIVGPGGYALTHPRSLTIAGPGAKVFAIPESTDLKDAILRTNLGRNFASEGVLVATGPVIYYSPDDRSQII